MRALRLSGEVREAIFVEMIEAWPKEGCGVVIGRWEDPSSHRFHRFDNLQDSLHAREPERYPRDGRTAFAIDPLALDRLVDASQQVGSDLVAVIHSHPQYPSYFSATDRAAASPFGFPTYPQAAHLVVSVFDREVRDLKGFFWDEASESFVEIPIEGLPALPGPPPGAHELREP